MAEQWQLPAPPDHPVQEGARWRWHRPSSEQVAQWFATQPLDEGMEHAHYVGGIVLIPQSEKARYTRPDGGSQERYEQVFIPYIQIGTRVGYFRRLAEKRSLRPVIEPAAIPRSSDSLYYNANMDEGLWWYAVQGDSGPLRYLCATWTVALYDGDRCVLQGRGTKQVTGGPDPNAIAKAQTGAIGRALGVAGILVIGTGIATAEDMQEQPGYGSTPVAPQAELPPVEEATAPAIEEARRHIAHLQARLETTPELWEQFLTWWKLRQQMEGWTSLKNVPASGLQAIIAKMETLDREAQS